jgi:hypothetical protein
MPKKKEPDLTPEEQFKRFQEAAKEHEIEKHMTEIEHAFGSLSGNGTFKIREGNPQCGQSKDELKE